MNKRHWISVYESEQMTAELIQELVETSYQLVVDTLSKAQQQALSIHAQINEITAI